MLLDDCADRDRVLDAWESEAARLFEYGRKGVERADRVFGLGVTVLIATTAAGLANDTELVVLGLPGGLGLLFSYVNQVYADVAAMGQARLRIEQKLAGEVGREVLIYETRTAPARHESGASLLTSAGVFLIQFASAAIGATIAFNEDWWIAALFTAGTLYGTFAALISYADMLRTSQLTEQKLAGWPAEGPPQRGSTSLHKRLVSTIKWIWNKVRTPNTAN